MVFGCVQYSELITNNFLEVVYRYTQYFKSVLLLPNTPLSEIFG